MITRRVSQVFLAIMGIAFCKVGIEAMIDPQAVVSQVGITLDNASALSSMRAVYGGMHFAFGCLCFWSVLRRPEPALGLIALYTGGFVAGRASSILLDGVPNAFVVTWLATETFALLMSVRLLLMIRHREVSASAQPG